MMLPVGLQRNFEGRYYPGKRGTSYYRKIACLGKQPSGSSLKLSEESLVSEWIREVGLYPQPSALAGEKGADHEALFQAHSSHQHSSEDCEQALTMNLVFLLPPFQQVKERQLG